MAGNSVVRFDKYARQGAYHWIECDPGSPQYNPPLEARYRLLVESIQNLAGVESLLDVGCGDGYLMARVSPVLKTVTGVDFEPAAVKLASGLLRSLPNCNVVLGSCYNLPVRDESFDLVLLCDVIEHLVDADRCLAEINRVLDHEGVLLVTTPKWRPDRMWDKRHVKEYTPYELQVLLESRFGEVRMTYFWPLTWSNFYSTRIGWRLTKYLARYICNPFLEAGREVPDRYGQILAVSRGPRP